MARKRACVRELVAVRGRGQFADESWPRLTPTRATRGRGARPDRAGRRREAADQPARREADADFRWPEPSADPRGRGRPGTTTSSPARKTSRRQATPRGSPRGCGSCAVTWARAGSRRRARRPQRLGAAGGATDGRRRPVSRTSPGTRARSCPGEGRRVERVAAGAAVSIASVSGLGMADVDRRGEARERRGAGDDDLAREGHRVGLVGAASRSRGRRWSSPRP